MGKIIAITNQKGGVGKTTTATNLGIGLSRLNRKVLLIDMDPQCSMTYAVGGTITEKGSYELILHQRTAKEVIQYTEEIPIIAASPLLGNVEHMLTQIGKEQYLRESLMPIMDDYDYIIIDAPPTLGVLTTNILTVADEVIIPSLADIFSLQGIGQLYLTVQAVRRYCNSHVHIMGFLLTRYQERLVLNREMKVMLAETAKKMDTKVFDTYIHESVLLREAQANQKSILSYSSRCRQAEDYKNFALEVLVELEG